MKRLAVGLVLVLASVVLGACFLPPGGYDVYPSDGQVVTEEVQSYVNATGSWSFHLHPVSTATATSTPTATNTATSAPTATSTPSPSPTLNHTATALPECTVTVVVTSSLRMRSDHSTGATLRAYAKPGSVWTLIAPVWYDDATDPADEWVQTRLDDGQAVWMAAYYQGETYAEYDLSGGCSALRWPGGVEPTDPPPSQTGSPTPAPTTGGTSEPMPTPTQPTGSPCQGLVVATEAFNIRSGHGTNFSKIGTLYPGDVVTVYETWVPTDPQFRWVRLSREASVDRPAVAGWAAFQYTPVDQNAFTETWISWSCSIPRTDEAPPLEDKTAYGVLTTVGADKTAAGEILNLVASAGRTPALTVVLDASMASAYNDRAYVIWRPWPDCSAMGDDIKADVKARLDYIELVTRHSAFDALQLTNECIWPSPSYLNQWTIEALARARERWPGKTIIPWVFAPGVFEPSWVPALRTSLTDMAAHGDLFGLNLYPARAGAPLGIRDAWSIWTTYRYEMIRAQMVPGADPCFAVTEAGAGDGNMALTPADAAAFVGHVDGDLCVVTFWHLSSIDPPGPWPLANMAQNYRVVFSAIAQKLIDLA